MASSSSWSSELEPYNPLTFRLGEVLIPQDHELHKIEVSDHDRTCKVRVYWDINKAFIDQPGYPVDRFVEYITQGIHNVDPDLEIGSFLGIGDTGPLKSSGQLESLINQGIDIVHAPERDEFHQCGECKANPLKVRAPPRVGGVKIESPHCCLIRRMIADAVDRDPEGIILIITGDSDFAPTLRFLVSKGMKVMLAQGKNSCPLFRQSADVTFYMEHLIAGKNPTCYVE